MKTSATVLIRLTAFLLCSSPVAALALGSPDMDDPPPFDCSQIVASGIGKQVNVRAGRMLADCLGLSKPGRQDSGGAPHPAQTPGGGLVGTTPTHRGGAPGGGAPPATPPRDVLVGAGRRH